jgi:hypothetical protein
LNRNRQARIPAAFFCGGRVSSQLGMAYAHENWSKVTRLTGKNALLLPVALGRMIGAESLSRALTKGRSITALQSF